MEDTIEAPAPSLGTKRLRYLLWPPNEPELADAGRSGEIIIARARLFILALLLLPSIATNIRDPSAPSGWLGIAVDLVCLAIGAEIFRRARAGNATRPLQIVTTLLDVSLVSGYHVLLFMVGEISMVLQSRVTFALYIFAIAGTALRYDGQLVRMAGLVAIVQYLAIIAWVTASERIADAGAFFYGDTSLAGQSEEVCILLIATVLGAIIVDRARELRLSGIRDPLTRLANRTYFSERMQSELRRSSRAQRPTAVAMIDIDHFKQINDAHGHAAGDMVLKRVAAELRKSLRGDDLVARLGGEEFAMLLSGISRDEAHQRLDAIRTTLRSTIIKLKWGVGVRVTVSVGYAMAPDDGTDGARLLELADARLMAGKRAGRDIVMASA